LTVVLVVAVVVPRHGRGEDLGRDSQGEIRKRRRLPERRFFCQTGMFVQDRRFARERLIVPEKA